MHHQKNRRTSFCQQGNNAERKQQPSDETASMLYKLDLGHHMLFILSDGSIDLLAHHEQPPARAENGMRLDEDETYRLFISLHEQFKHSSDGESRTAEKGRDTHE
jgi:hypothetical protein